MKHIDIERVRKESANVLVIENANPGAPHLQSVYVDDLCDAIDSLRARAEKVEAALGIEREASAIALRAEQMQRITAETRADRYLAAMTALVETDGTDAEWLAPLAAIRSIVEEVRRG